MIPDYTGLSNNHSRPVVDKKMASDPGPGIDINPGYAMGVFGHHPGEQRDLLDDQLMGQPIDGNGREAWIAEDDLDLKLLAAGSP